MTTRDGKATRFPLGSVYMTRSAMAWLSDVDVLKALARHTNGDWGDVDSEDWASNDAAVLHDARLLSVYTAAGGAKFWVITEADRSSTTILLPADY